MILVTGAAGKTGQAVINAVVRRDGVVRALVRREAQVELVKAKGAVEVVVGDMADTAVYQLATQNICAIYHICPNMHPDEVQIGKVAIAAAQQNHVERFVYHSVMHPQTETMPHHWHKLQVEALLFASGLNYTILQPAAYMQNIMGSWASIVEEGVYTTPYPVETQISIIDLADVVEVAAKVLTEVGHDFAVYELAGPENLSQIEVAAALQTHLGKRIIAKEIAHEMWRKNAESAGLSTYAIETLLNMFRYYAENGFVGNSNILIWLLRRKPTTFVEFLQSLTVSGL